MSLESTYQDRVQREMLRERFPGFIDVGLEQNLSQSMRWFLVAYAWNGAVGTRSFSDVTLDDAPSLRTFFDEKLHELHFELAPEAVRAA